MFQKSKGVDIVCEIGGINTIEAAMACFESRLDATHLARINEINNPAVLIKIANAIVMCDPDKVYINTGSHEDKQFIRELALQKCEEATLPMNNHTIHYDLKNEQGRIVDRTFYISNPDEDVSTMANKKMRDEALEDIRDKMTGIMKGKTMVIGFYMRGPVGSPVSNPALEITSSAYVSHSAELLYRNAFKAFDNQVYQRKHFFTNIHSEGMNRPEDLPNARVYMDRSHQTTYSFNCTYAGNTLLLKKGNHRFAVDKAIYENRGNELSEHMFITGLKDDTDNTVTWFAGAAPSGCGKTTTAMVGTHFVGDDLAQIWIDAKGNVCGINPECGIFGIVQDVNSEGDPLLMDCLRNEKTEVIWSNVLIDDDGKPHWLGNGEPPPAKGKNFQGYWETGLTCDNGKLIPFSHPNARFTLSSEALDTFSDQSEDPAGVNLDVITYSGRDGDTMPPVWVAKTPDHGVVIGACIVSAATAAEVGATGVKRAPWANAPFIPGALGDYMDAQFKFFNNSRIAKSQLPIMAGLNYFLTHKARGGDSLDLLGEKSDVRVWLTWLGHRRKGKVDAILTPIGYIPKYDDLKKLFAKLIQKDYTHELYNKQFSLYLDNILARIDFQVTAYRKEIKIPERIFEILEEQKQSLTALKEKHGSIVLPDQL